MLRVFRTNQGRSEAVSVSKALYSSATNEWATERAFFAKLNRRYRFTLDPCATAENATCPLFFTKADNGLVQDWGTHRVFCNPPYGRGIGAWARKCFEAAQGGALAVLFVPARTDTKWFHDWVEGKADIQFLRGRMRFGQSADSRAPFPSMLAVYRPRPGTKCARCGEAFVGRRDAVTCSNACRQALYRKRYTSRRNAGAALGWAARWWRWQP
jgi:site-specific DNA-methyltransferase (adenine-specific)